MRSKSNYRQQRTRGRQNRILYLSLQMTEASLEGKLANWNGAHTADYGAICNDLAQLKLNKVPVKFACALINRQYLHVRQCPRVTIPVFVLDTDCSISTSISHDQATVPLLAGAGSHGGGSTTVPAGPCSYRSSSNPRRRRQCFRG